MVRTKGGLQHCAWLSNSFSLGETDAGGAADQRNMEPLSCAVAVGQEQSLGERRTRAGTEEKPHGDIDGVLGRDTYTSGTDLNEFREFCGS
jgi:hypothetical protein